MFFTEAFQYKQWANEELLRFGERQLHLLPDDDTTFFIRILNHTAVVDSLFISRLSNEAEQYRADNTVETPTLNELRQFMVQNDTWLVKFASSLTTDDANRVISFQFTDGDFGQLSVQEILLHLLTHGSNHRGMASRVLMSHSLERPKDIFTRYLHEANPSRRQNARERLS